MKRKYQLLGFAPELANPAAPMPREVNELLMAHAEPRLAKLLITRLEQAAERHKERLAEDEEARRRRMERLAEHEDERRNRGEEAFACKRWSHERAVSWIGWRNKADLDRPTRHGAMYDHGGSRLVDKEPEKSLVEAVEKGRLLKFMSARGEVWYESEQVKALFPEAERSGPSQDTVGDTRLRMSEAAMLKLLPPFIEQLYAKTVKDRRSFSQVDAHKQAEDHFQKRIDREAVRAICRKKRLTGEVGRPRKIPRQT